MNEPLSPPAAKALLVEILEKGGKVSFSTHALEEMEKDGISQQEVIGVLRGGVVEPAELRNASWRYRVRRSKVYSVVTFRSETWTVVVTSWRAK